MTGFMLWMHAKWAAWLTLRGFPCDMPLTDGHHKEFDAWLGQPTNMKGTSDARR